MNEIEQNVMLQGIQEHLESYKELEMIPIALAMQGIDIRDVRRINTRWLIRQEAVQMYAKLPTLEDQDIMPALMTYFNDPYLSKVWPVAQDYRARDIANKIHEAYNSRTEKIYLQQFAYSTAIKDKLAALDRIKVLYADRSEEVYIPDYNNPSPDMRFFFDIDGVPCVAQGDITAIKGKAKGGKTTFLKMLTAAAISQTGEVCGIKRNDDDADTTRQEKALRVLYFDTEQSKCSTDKMLRGVIKMADLARDNTPNLKIVNTRRMKTKNRMDRFEEELAFGSYDIVILDGVKDIVKNINDPEETDIVVSKLLTIVQDKNIALIVVLHENPGKDTDKMRGWLGTEVTNKAFMVWQVSSNKNTNKYTISCTECREMAPPDIAYRWNDDGEIERCDPDGESDTATATEQKPRNKEEKVHDAFMKCFMAEQLARPFNELQDIFIRCTNLSARTFANYVPFAIAKGFIDKDSEGRYSPSIQLRSDIAQAKFNEIPAPILSVNQMAQLTDDELKGANAIEELPF